jgi:hypothetical protein
MTTPSKAKLIRIKNMALSLIFLSVYFLYDSAMFYLPEFIKSLFSIKYTLITGLAYDNKQALFRIA